MHNNTGKTLFVMFLWIICDMDDGNNIQYQADEWEYESHIERKSVIFSYYNHLDKNICPLYYAVQLCMKKQKTKQKKPKKAFITKHMLRHLVC